MGNLSSCFASQGEDAPDKKEKPGKGIVKHRQAEQNRVTEDEMQLAEVKSRINKIKEYQKKNEKQIAEQEAKVKQLAREGNKQRAIIALKHKKFLVKEQDKIAGAELMLVQTV